MTRSMGWVMAVAAIFAGVVGAKAQAVAQTEVQTEAQTVDMTGAWQGTLHAGKDLRIVLKVTEEDGGLKAVAHSIDLGPGAVMDAASVTLAGTSFRFSVAGVDASYEGRLSADGNTITGTMMRGANPLPLTLVRATRKTEWEIPEPPKPIPSMAVYGDPSIELAMIRPNDMRGGEQMVCRIRTDG